MACCYVPFFKIADTILVSWLCLNTVRACKLLTIFFVVVVVVLCIWLALHVTNTAETLITSFLPYSFLLYDVLSGNKKSRKVMRQVPNTPYVIIYLSRSPSPLTSPLPATQAQTRTLL